jgi:phosphoribosylaminoimidazole-succinocarboxamide synthase
LIENGFQGKEGQSVPEMNDAWTNEISERYIELYEKVAGEKFIKHPSSDIAQRIEQNVIRTLETLK